MSGKQETYTYEYGEYDGDGFSLKDATFAHDHMKHKSNKATATITTANNDVYYVNRSGAKVEIHWNDIEKMVSNYFSDEDFSNIVQGFQSRYKDEPLGSEYEEYSKAPEPEVKEEPKPEPKPEVKEKPRKTIDIFSNRGAALLAKRIKAFVKLHGKVQRSAPSKMDFDSLYKDRGGGTAFNFIAGWTERGNKSYHSPTRIYQGVIVGHSAEDVRGSDKNFSRLTKEFLEEIAKDFNASGDQLKVTEHPMYAYYAYGLTSYGDNVKGNYYEDFAQSLGGATGVHNLPDFVWNKSRADKTAIKVYKMLIKNGAKEESLPYDNWRNVSDSEASINGHTIRIDNTNYKGKRVVRVRVEPALFNPEDNWDELHFASAKTFEKKYLPTILNSAKNTEE